ncbi:FtsB family cell division protein [Frateuria aurantia]
MLRITFLVLLLVLLALQFKLWGEHGALRQLQARRSSLTELTDQNAQLVQRNQALGADVEDLKSGDQAIEARARGELGLIKPGEVFYQVVDPAGGSSTGSTQGPNN